jgi:NADPH2:quinone reductase
VIVTHYGGPGALRLVEEECPEPRDGEVRVKMLAAGVSLPDVMAREGVHPETPPAPFTPGWDLVGVVDRLGNGTSGIEPGEIVAALPIHGAYAECGPARVDPRRGRRGRHGALAAGSLAQLEMYGTCSSRSARAVSDLGGTPD